MSSENENPAAKQQWPQVVILRTPIQFGKGTTIESLSFSKGTFGVLKGMNIDRVPSVDEIMVIASRLTGQQIKVFELLDPDDVDEVAALALDFFARCRTGGKTPSQS